MGRYDLPDPKCNHVRKGRVQAGDSRVGPFVSTAVCDCPACVEDAKQWAYASTHLEAMFLPDSPEIQARLKAGRKLLRNG